MGRVAREQAHVGRLCRGAEIREVLRRGRHFAGDSGVLKVRRGKESVPRLCVVASKRVGGAVTRNLVRRRIREIARREIEPGVSPVDMVFRANAESGRMDFEGIYEAFTGQLRRAGLIHRPRREQWTGGRR